MEKSGSDSILLARTLAEVFHRGQKDKTGHDYIEHPQRVAFAVKHFGWEYEVTAWLHDIVEDCGIELNTIENLFGSTVRDAVDAVTRRGPDGSKEIYAVFIRRAKESRIGRIVKLADLHDNMIPERIACLPLNERDIIKRYRKAVEILES